MNASFAESTRARADRGPALYYGYCSESSRYRMMDLPDYMSNVQQGMSRLMNEPQTLYQDVTRAAYVPASAPGRDRKTGSQCGCGCRTDHCKRTDCHCECCVCDADILVHARCGETRRVPVTFVNDTRRDRPVTLALDKFVTSGGRDLGWPVQLSETTFTLRPCDERVVTVLVGVRCDQTDTPGDDQKKPGRGADPAATAADSAKSGQIDRCEVGYATLRAEGCLIRPVVVAVAVLPDDCDAYERRCSCGCC